MLQLDVFKRKLLQLLDDNGFTALHPVFEEIRQSAFQYDKPALVHLERDALNPVIDQNSYITRLKVFIGSITSSTSHARHPGIPLRPPYFIGREKQLEKIHELLADPSGRLPVLLLSGIGGMGKTTLMQEYLHQDACQQYFNRIVFVSVDKNLTTAFVDGACTALGLDDKKRQAKYLAGQLNLVIQEMKNMTAITCL
ncbi:ATP-binding protein [Paraflavitalea speifideaquila]|uniref:ATP-binding protein n=1 Tax=Paraflavitalea speifideaquila TaxID=3076558 RepID=UPI0028E6FB41|nr:ATP-binding protein [Paraflavitalea speifideiaquila]